VLASVPSPAVTLQLRAPRVDRPQPSGVHAVLTQANAVVGTPAYMAPEQAAGAPFDARADQYALSVTLLDALLGQRPARRAVAPKDPAAIEAALAGAGIAAGVRGAIVRGLAEDPAARFPAIDDLLHAIAPRPPAVLVPVRSWRAPLAIAGVALCGIAAAAWFVVGRGTEPGCTAEASERWSEARARVVTALSASTRPFAGWDAERVAAAIDSAVGSLATAEVARCGKVGSATRDDSPDCLVRRAGGLRSALAALSAAPAPDDPWPFVGAIERCEASPPDEHPTQLRDELRGELRGATAERARQIAEAARTAGLDRLAADALEVAGRAALAADEPTAAEADFQSMATAGERTGDDAVRGRALLALIAAARWRGSHADGKRALDQLHAMLARHRDAPRDQLVVAIAEAEASGDLGDVATALAAWDRAAAAAAALGDHDGALAAAAGRAWATYVLRFDLDGARRQVGAALAVETAASPAARRTALGVAADLAIEAGDGNAAQAAIDEANRMVPPGPRLPADRVRAQRARAVLGDVDGAVDALVPEATDDATAAARIAIARGKVLLAADHASEAADVLDKVSTELRGSAKARAALPVAERIDLELASCDAQQAAIGSCKTRYRLDLLVKGLPAGAPARARLALVSARDASALEARSMRAYHLTRALDILIEVDAPPLRVAELRWQLAQRCAAGTDCRKLATAAREAFLGAGRTAEVAEIDRWLADPSAASSPAGRDDGAASGSAPSRRESMGPQP
jgi:hypothetical protein